MRYICGPVLVLLATANLIAGQVPVRTLNTDERLARDIFKELIEIDTTDSTGDCTKAAEAMASRFRTAGFGPGDVQVLGPSPKKQNVVARLRGTGAGRPILLIAHLDVVEARRDDWSFDPFVFLERDGYYYGRGTSDIKSGAAVLAANLIRLKQEGYRPARDLIVALTADEEGGTANGVEWLLQHRKDLIDAEYCLNTDSGGGSLRQGVKTANELQTSEKVYLSFTLETRNSGGHSALPVKDNAIYHLAEGLSRLARFEFPARLNETTRAFFERMAGVVKGAVGADMKAVAANPLDAVAAARLAAASAYYNALMRTTCVATRLEGGHADNALPQMARATVNCRMLPEDSPGDVQAALVRVLADPAITVRPNGAPRPSPASPLRPDVVRGVERVTTAMWPGVPVVPIMSTGASDGLLLRRAGIPVYGVSGLFDDIDDVRAHGRDERMAVWAFFDGLEFMYRLEKELAGEPLAAGERR
ncbi:MAG TPA: M20/M25/M40 family metallo-hydrolase [Vicinamibacterales bacterium]|jgi:acetylornithine deacetylase/succinyl-diaminopimelate desuccinylase-like protein